MLDIEPEPDRIAVCFEPEPSKVVWLESARSLMHWGWNLDSSCLSLRIRSALVSLSNPARYVRLQLLCAELMCLDTPDFSFFVCD